MFEWAPLVGPSLYSQRRSRWKNVCCFHLSTITPALSVQYDVTRRTLVFAGCRLLRCCLLVKRKRRVDPPPDSLMAAVHTFSAAISLNNTQDVSPRLVNKLVGDCLSAVEFGHVPLPTSSQQPQTLRFRFCQHGHINISGFASCRLFASLHTPVFGARVCATWQHGRYLFCNACCQCLVHNYVSSIPRAPLAAKQTLSGSCAPL